MALSRPNDAARELSMEPPEALPGLAGRLFGEPYCFDFFQSVRLLQRLYPTQPRVGRGGPPSEEVVRFRSLVSLSFPPSAIYDLVPRTSSRSFALMTQAFLGLAGPSGVLPRHYTELLIRLQKDLKGPDRYTLRDWFDLFNHRMVSFFYRAWEKYRFPLAFELREHEKADPDPFTKALLSYTGLGLSPLRGRVRITTPLNGSGKLQRRDLAKVDDLAILYYAGYFAHRPRNAISLKGLIEDFFEVLARVEQFRGQWLHLEPESQTRLGNADSANQLGFSAMAGERVWDVRSKIRIRLGPLPYKTFLSLIPDTTTIPERKAFFILSHLVRLYVGPELDFEVQLILRAPDVPNAELSDGEELGPRLGWNTWVRSLPMDRDAEDAVFQGDDRFVLLDESGPS
jgi:type VI secretion system protein ImpH